MTKENSNDLNVIEQLEEKIGKALKRLDLSTIETDNGYTSEANGAITGLNLNHTKITDLSLIKELKHLTYLDLSSNMLTDISPIKELKALKTLNLSSNKAQETFNFPENEKNKTKKEREFEFIPRKPLDISPLQELSALRELYLDDIGLSDLSPLKDLKGLTVLSLNKNQCSDLSPLQELTTLAELYLSSNLVLYLSPLIGLKNLKRVNAANNRIAQLTGEILQLGLEIKWEFSPGNGIFLEGNPLETPPVEVVKQGIAAVLNYFAEIQQESVPLLESKLLIVGNGEVGKTTLMRKLRDNTFNVEIGKEPTTHGINIEPWEMECSFNSGQGTRVEKVKLHAWDFGGQDIYHATHQFFLTKRSLYLLVWEPRKEDESLSLDYWLNIIRLLGAESPVIVVMNKADIRRKAVDEATYKEKFTNIRDFLQVSCLTGEGIENLTGQIRANLGKMPHLKDKLPRGWQQIRDHLKKVEKNYIPFNEYLDICRWYGLNEERAKFLSGYLHDLGSILHFSDDLLLADTMILKPEWATTAVYKLVDSREIQENKGRFKTPELRNYWDYTQFPREIHPQLLRLLEKFELCFPVAGTNIFILPELLPVQRPPLEADRYKAPGSLHFQYHYDFMPAGIITRFISRMYYLIKDDHYWKTGVELHLEDTHALVTAEQPNRRIKIAITGPNQRELLAIARNDFEHIHKTLNMERGKHYEEMIPCNCSECSKSPEPEFFMYKVLKRMRSKNKVSTLCPKSIEDVSIDGLLMGIEPPKPKKDLLETLINTGIQLHSVGSTLKSDEDSRNGFMALLLSTQGFVVKEQSRRGQSAPGKTLGCPDLDVETTGSELGGMIEAFNLIGLDSRVIEGHLSRLLNYEPGGPVEYFILVYSEAPEFHRLWEKYLNHLRVIDLNYRLVAGPEEQVTPSRDIKLARTGHLYEGKEIKIYHIFINMRT